MQSKWGFTPKPSQVRQRQAKLIHPITKYAVFIWEYTNKTPGQAGETNQD